MWVPFRYSVNTIIAFYYLKDKDIIVNSFMKLINDRRKRESLKVIAGEIDVVLGGFIRAACNSCFVGIITGGM